MIKELENKLTKLRAIKEAGKEISSEDKIKVAVLADSPTVVTGFGNVCKEILGVLYDTDFYDFEIVGINYDGSPHDLPYKIYPAFNGLIPDAAYRDMYGKQRFLDLIGEGRFDLVWVLQDTFILEQNNFGKMIAQTNQTLSPEHRFAFIFYFPIDATPKKSWIDNSVMMSHHPIAYTQYALNETLKVYAVDEDSLLDEKQKEENLTKKAALEESLNVVYHGVNTSDFYPKTDAEKKELKAKLWGEEKKDRFVFVNVNRNQPRKDYYRTLLAFKKLLDKRRAAGKGTDVYLYTHCNLFDSGLNMVDMSQQIGLVQGDEFAHPDPKAFNVSSGVPVSVINDIYNASDCLITTTLGEGWGLSLTEAMATKLPIIAPDHTSITEILGKTEGGSAERGVLVKTDMGFVQANDNGRVRYTTDVDDLVEAMDYMVENRKVFDPMVERAYEWVKTLDWQGDLVGGKWRKIFEEAYEGNLITRAEDIDVLIAKSIKQQGLGRNDDCPVCKIKYKGCRHYGKA